MDFLPENISAYVQAHTSAEPTLLTKLNRETHVKILYPRMLSGHLQGRILSFFSHMMRPSRILEIGTYTGYSCLCLAEGLVEGGCIDAVERDAELETMINAYLDEANLSQKVNLHIGDAREVVPTLIHTYDMVFIDADKSNYLLYYEMVLPKLRPGGVILADNVLWSGKVVTEASPFDKETIALQQFNDFVQQDARVSCVLLPVRDGIMMVRKL